MSYNQSRSDRSETQYRRIGGSASFNTQRRSSGSHSKGAGAGPAPSSPVTLNPHSLSSNRSFKKFDNAQGGHARLNASAVVPSQAGSGTAHRNLQNGAHVQPQLHRASDASKPTEPPGLQRSIRAVPKAPTSRSTTLKTEFPKQTTPEKAPGDANKAIPFQFGSLSPGLMNGMQIPARTSSAPPNLDEQKHSQACHNSVPMPHPSTLVQNQQSQNKTVDPTSTREANPAMKEKKDAHVSSAHPAMKEKKDVHVTSASPPSSIQKSPVPSAPVSSMQMPHRPPQGPLQFGGPNSQIQPPNVTASSLQMPMAMPLPMGNAPHVQQPVLVPGLQSHPMSHQGIMHQGNGMRFTTPMGPQLPPQLSHMGLGMVRQYPQQQGGMFGSQRKTSVKITHPETREELKLDRRSDTNLDTGSSVSRPYPNITGQSHSVSAFSNSHPLNYFPNSYNTAPMFFPPSSIPLTSGQMITNPQVPRYTYSHGQGSQNVQHVDSSAHNSISSNVASRPASDGAQDGKHIVLSASSGATAVTIKPVPVSIAEKVQGSFPSSLSATEKVRSPKFSRPPEQINSVPQRDVGPDVDPQKACGASSSIRSSTTIADKALRTSNASDPKAERVFERLTDSSSELSSSVASMDAVDNRKLDISINQDGKNQETQTFEEERRLSRNNLEHDCSSEVSKELIPSNSLNHVYQMKNESNSTRETTTTEYTVKEEAEGKLDELEGEIQGDKKICDGLDVLSSSTNAVDAGSSIGEETATLDAASSGMPDQQSSSISLDREGTLICEDDFVKTSHAGSASAAVSVSHDKSSLESNRGKNTPSRGKKKRKEILQKADAAGTTADLYMAYKGPEEEKEAVVPSDNRESVSVHANTEQAAAGCSGQDASKSKDCAQDKAEPDDWEDAADLNAAELGGSDNVPVAHGGPVLDGRAGNGNMEKKYSRDFLLKFADRCTELPQTFQIVSDIADTLMSIGPNVSRVVERDSHGSPGRVMDRQGSGSRLDRRANSVVDDNRWMKTPGPFVSGRDLRMDIGWAANMGFRPVQGGNSGVLRNPRAHAPVHYAGGILPGQMQVIGPHGGMVRNNIDPDRWQRATNFQQKGLIPYPQTPMQMMHKAEKKYEVGKITDEEQAKQRRLKGILNKLTPQNFEKLFEQVKEVNIDNADTLTGVISQIFDKALMEPTFCEMYANFCFYLAGELPDFVEGEEKITFKRLLLNKCQEEFERGEREEEEANKVEEGEGHQTEQEREEKRVKVRRRMLGNIRLIGELYKKRMLTERIMHSCIQKLLGQYPNPDEEDIEALCKLLSTIGEMIDHPKAKEHIDSYFERLAVLSNNKILSSRVRFMLNDIIDLRKNKWQQRRKIEGPKKIEEVHRDAAQERQTQVSRLSRGPGINPSTRRGPADFSPRGSTTMSSPNSQMGGFRGMSPQVRGFGAQDARFARPTYEPRALSVQLSQKHIGDELITLGPQGGLGRGMSVRGSTPMPSVPAPDVPPAGDSRRMTSSLNGVSPLQERTTCSSREDVTKKLGPERSTASSAHKSISAQERGMNYGNRDLRHAENSFDRPLETSSPLKGQGLSLSKNVSSEKVLPEDRLHKLSMAAIKEFYSARDEKEVALCVKELNLSSFHPTMISLWVNDSFERKDAERDLLAKLLIYLVKSVEGTLSQAHLMKGFECVLTGLEDAVCDAPKAAEFLGRIFAKIIVENVVSLSEVGRLIHEGGEEPGCLLEIGLAGDVLGSTLETIKSERGEDGLNEIRAGAGLRLEDFRPHEPKISKLLEKFI